MARFLAESGPVFLLLAVIGIMFIVLFNVGYIVIRSRNKRIQANIALKVRNLEIAFTSKVRDLVISHLSEEEQTLFEKVWLFPQDNTELTMLQSKNLHKAIIQTAYEHREDKEIVRCLLRLLKNISSHNSNSLVTTTEILLNNIYETY